MPSMPLEAYKEDFVKFMAECGALSFGDFALKSGRRSPFFFNAGACATGASLAKLGEFYAAAIHSSFGDGFDILFGPAYKGIPIAASAAMAHFRLFGKEVRYSANRKEAKGHGDAGPFLGAAPRDGDRVIIVEDVITSGSSIKEALPLLLSAAKVEIKGLMISLDRQERASGGSQSSALEEISALYGFPAHSIVTMKEAVSFLKKTPVGGKILIGKEMAAAISKYYSEYGAAAWER